ncbi:hypothetical protein HZ326_21119 [Fusarium oxysporum f. sp. albedinis]|nr:hypothetical protein HZ326_21119 [Fusarium oxysporum f. sp. albedinis]
MHGLRVQTEIFRSAWEVCERMEEKMVNCVANLRRHSALSGLRVQVAVFNIWLCYRKTIRKPRPVQESKFLDHPSAGTIQHQQELSSQSTMYILAGAEPGRASYPSAIRA